MLVLVSFIINAQESYGVKGGFSEVSGGGDSVTGFNFGGFLVFNMSEKFDVQTELLYQSFDGGSLISLPILAKYSINSQFNVLAGPSLNKWKDSDVRLNFDLGLIYYIKDKFDINAKYSMGKDDISIFNIGVGYKLNL